MIKKTIVYASILLCNCTFEGQKNDTANSNIQISDMLGKEFRSDLVFDTLTEYQTRIIYHGNLGQLDSLFWSGSDFNRKILFGEHELRSQGIFEWENDNFIAIRYGCGAPCWGYWLLPKNNSDNPINYLYTIDFDIKNNLVAYYENTEDLTTSIVIENMITGKKKKCEFDEFCDGLFPFYCETYTEFNDQRLLLQWVTSLDSSKALLRSETFDFLN